MKKKWILMAFVLFLGMAAFAETSPEGYGDIIPHRYRGATLKGMYWRVHSTLRYGGVFGGAHTGQFLNPSYGRLYESGRIQPKLGYSFGAYISAAYPVFFDVELTNYKDVFDNSYVNENQAVSGFASLALFPFSFSTSTIIIPIVGIGLQHAKFTPKWKLSQNSEVEPMDEVIQPLYKIGLIINIPTGNDEVGNFHIIGNYYHSLFVENQPHSLVGFTVGIGFSYH